MKIGNKEIDTDHLRKSLLCIAAGTGMGLIVYIIFLKLKIAIFGWNLGLIFAPLIAGYVETIFANRLIGENIGAISAFILFIDTTFYSFILKNPTLGFNIITAGSIVVILQAAFPTLINYILLVVIGGIISNFIKTIKKHAKKIGRTIKKKQPFRWDSSNIEAEVKEEVEEVQPFDEKTSNQKLNNLNFYFFTNTDMKKIKHDILGIYHSEVILEKDKGLVKIDPEQVEQKVLNRIKEGKDECLIRISDEIKKNGGNGILDLTIHYSLIGMGGENIQITAMGMGIYLPD